MTLIKPRTTGVKSGRFITKIYVENLELLCAYAAMIGETTEYIINELVASLEKDTDYKKWRADHQATYYDAPAKRADKPAKRPRTTTLSRAV